MISLKMALVIVAAFAAGSFFTPPVQQAIAAVIATDVQCTGCVGTTDLAGNGVTAAKIKDSEVKAAEIATDSVGAAELQGVTKLLFGKCVVDSTGGTSNVAPGNGIAIHCAINGVDLDDRALAQKNSGNGCFTEREVYPFTGSKTGIDVVFVNECTTTQQFGTGSKI
ncbi:MAG TPA: hypothetical protein VGQ03_08975, partial [Nitrososphaera sp.]|nr:hypothetical protein [Nitrososphaera sp.]